MTQPLTMNTNLERNYAVIALNGYVNQTGGEQVASECHRLIDEGALHLILNLERAPIVNSVGIALPVRGDRARPGFGRLGFLSSHYASTGVFSPHIWAGFVGGSFCFLSALTLVIGLVGDMLVRVRLNQETILYHLRRGEDAPGP